MRQRLGEQDVPGTIDRQPSAHQKLISRSAQASHWVAAVQVLQLMEDELVVPMMNPKSVLCPAAHILCRAGCKTRRIPSFTQTSKQHVLIVVRHEWAKGQRNTRSSEVPLSQTRLGARCVFQSCLKHAEPLMVLSRDVSWGKESFLSKVEMSLRDL